MVVFDTDALSEILRGAPAMVARADSIPGTEQAITAETAEELMRGRLDKIREAQSRRDAGAIVVAYHWFVETVGKLGRVRILRDSEAAEAQFRAWQRARVKVRPNDLRIAAIVHALGATLVTCNRRDFALVPDLRVEFWA